MWTVGLTVEIKLRFRDGLVWKVGLTVEIKLCFRDDLVWTAGLTVEIKLRFSWRISVNRRLNRRNIKAVFSKFLQRCVDGTSEEYTIHKNVMRRLSSWTAVCCMRSHYQQRQVKRLTICVPTWRPNMVTSLRSFVATVAENTTSEFLCREQRE